MINRKSEKGLHTELREEKQEDEEGRGEGNNATGECTAEEIIIDFRVGVQIPQLLKDAVHGLRPALTTLNKFLSFLFFSFLFLYTTIQNKIKCLITVFIST